MGKIVKYCAECEEGFAEKFSFCPNCASSLTAYEMNPAVTNEALKVAEPVEEETKTIPLETTQSLPPAAEVNEPVTSQFAADDDLDLLDDNTTSHDDIIADNETVSEPKAGAEIFAPAVVSGGYNQNFNYSPENYAADYASNSNGSTDGYQAAEINNRAAAPDGNYHITFVEDKNASGRHLLLLGAFLLVTATVFGGIVYSLFKQNPYIGSLNDNDVLVAYADPDAVPDEVKPDIPELVKKDKGGGGGGGGNHEEQPVSHGVLATQMEKPLIPPSAHMDQVTNPPIPITPATQGNRQEKPTDQPYGNPNSKFDIASDGPGNGGGQGSGNGRGQGSGIGTGAGSGSGSGNGSGRGTGNGGGNGPGGDEPPKIPVKPPPPVVEPFKILSKPRANYTDTARQNQVTGVVRVRVTFLPSGSIGSVTPLNSLPYGLTDQAIAAAKQIRFEPQKSNGVPVPVTKVIEYSFSIY